MGDGKAFMQGHHPKTKEDDFRTPNYILKWVEETYGKITHDGACSKDNAVSKAFDLFGNDNLTKGDVLFINPPWNTEEVIKFVEAAAKQVKNGAIVVFLLPNKITEVSWVEQVDPWFAEVTILGGRVDFSGPHSVKGGASRWGCIIATIGEHTHTHSIWSQVTLKELKKREKERIK